MAFDPAVLVDDDGSGYLYCGGGIPDDTNPASIANPGTGRVIKLGDDMISTVGSAVRIDAPYFLKLQKYINTMENIIIHTVLTLQVRILLSILKEKLPTW